MKAKTDFLLRFATLLGLAGIQSLAAESSRPHSPAPLHPPVYQDTNLRAAPTGQPGFTYEQRPITNTFTLVTAEQTQAVLDRFRTAYPQIQSPRIGIVVNPGQAKPDTNSQTSSLADRQTWRDVERMFGRPLRMAGAQLADQTVLLDALGSNTVSEFLKPGENPARTNLSRLADVVVEVLVSPKTMTAATLTGDVSFVVPDLQATAIRLQDSRVLGQATSSDILARIPPSLVRQRDLREIIEATALVLMEDMSNGY